MAQQNGEYIWYRVLPIMIGVLGLAVGIIRPIYQEQDALNQKIDRVAERGRDEIRALAHIGDERWDIIQGGYRGNLQKLTSLEQKFNEVDAFLQWSWDAQNMEHQMSDRFDAIMWTKIFPDIQWPARDYWPGSVGCGNSEQGPTAGGTMGSP